MLNLKGLFQKNKIDEAQDKKKKPLHSWYEERYDLISVQRSWLLVLLTLAILTTIAAIGALTVVVTTKTFDPFVIQIENKTGAAKIVNPTTSTLLGGNEALARYFIKKYIIARETYNQVNYDYNVKQVARLLSTADLYYTFRAMMRSEENDPTVKYGTANSTSFVSKSFSKLPTDKSGKTYVVRFAIQEDSGARRRFDKVAIVKIDYVPMQLSEKERDINPVGFQVKGYRVDDDRS